ncbi:unnamed protein product [Brassica rapa subsp. trilocularis]
MIIYLIIKVYASTSSFSYRQLQVKKELSHVIPTDLSSQCHLSIVLFGDSFAPSPSHFKRCLLEQRREGVNTPEPPSHHHQPPLICAAGSLKPPELCPIAPKILSCPRDSVMS